MLALVAPVSLAVGTKGIAPGEVIKALTAPTAFTNGVTLLDPLAFNDFRYWAVGALAGRELSVLVAVGPFLIVGAAPGARPRARLLVTQL